MQTEREIDLIAVIAVLWKNKLILVAATVMAAGLSVMIALSIPNVYQASVILAPTNDDSSRQMAGLAQTLGAFTGGGAANQAVSPAEIALKTLESRKFVAEFINRHELLVPLMTIESWDPATGEAVYNEGVYDRENEKWLGEGAPSRGDVYKRFTDRLLVEKDAVSGFFTISFSSPVPELACKWLTLLIQDVNQEMRRQEIADTQKKTLYLYQQIEKTSVAEIENIFFQLITEEEKKALLAQTTDEFILRTIDPAVTPEKKSEPRRAVIAILGTLLGGLFGLLLVYIKTALPHLKSRWGNVSGLK